MSDFCPLKSNFQPQTHKTIVFKPGPVQGSGSGSPGFERVARVNPYFIKKNQNDVILVKKKKSTSCNRVFYQVLPGHTRSWLFLFFLQPGLVPVPGPRPGFKTMPKTHPHNHFQLILNLQKHKKLIQNQESTCNPISFLTQICFFRHFQSNKTPNLNSPCHMKPFGIKI